MHFFLIFTSFYLQELLYLLFNKGPYIPGIFRKSANVKRCREVRELLDQGEEIRVDDVPVFVAAAIIKVIVTGIPLPSKHKAFV